MIVDARFWFLLYHDQDFYSINSTMTKISLRKVFFLEVPAYTEADQSTPVVSPA